MELSYIFEDNFVKIYWVLVEELVERNFHCNTAHAQDQGVPRGKKATELLSDQ